MIPKQPRNKQAEPLATMFQEWYSAIESFYFRCLKLQVKLQGELLMHNYYTFQPEPISLLFSGADQFFSLLPRFFGVISGS